MSKIKSFFKKLRLLFKSESEILTELAVIHFNIKAEPFDVNSMNATERGEALRTCFELSHSHVFNHLIDSLKQTVINDTMRSATSFNHLLCGKMSLHGIEMVESQIKTLGIMHEMEVKQKTEVYDEYSLI